MTTKHDDAKPPAARPPAPAPDPHELVRQFMEAVRAAAPSTREEAARALAEAQRARDQKNLDEARERFPPGTKLFVTTARGIKVRCRSGLQFSSDGRSEVTVVELPDDKLADMVRAGAYVTSPIGAKAIADDTGEIGGLIVFTSPEDAATAATPGDDRDQLRAELAALRAENARLKRAAPEASSTGARERTSTSPDFGGELRKPEK